jgi:hypothetical protein
VESEKIDQLIIEGRNIQAIAALREEHGYSLQEAIEAFHDRAQTLSQQTSIESERPPAYQLTTADGRTINNPTGQALHRALASLSVNNWYAILERHDGWYLQVGYGTEADTRPGWYALERQDGGHDEHYRTIVTDLREVLRELRGRTKRDGGTPVAEGRRSSRRSEIRQSPGRQGRRLRRSR